MMGRRLSASGRAADTQTDAASVHYPGFDALTRGNNYMKRITLSLLFAVAMALSGAAFAAEGHCSYTQENMFAGPYKVCQQPADAAKCEELGTTDDNADAVHGDGDCPTENLVGTCDTGDFKLLYYEGDPGGLEIGCGFQGGEWVTP